MLDGDVPRWNFEAVGPLWCLLSVFPDTGNSLGMQHAARAVLRLVLPVADGLPHGSHHCTLPLPDGMDSVTLTSRRAYTEVYVTTSDASKY